MTDVDDFDHESHMQRAVALSREAMERGDRPFGSVLVRDDEVLMEASNRVVTEADIRRHPELHLAYRAVRELDAQARAETVMYTSAEPCPMCAGGMLEAGFDRVVYGVGSEELATFTGGPPNVGSASILSGVTAVEGPVLHERARAVHEEYDW